MAASIAVPALLPSGFSILGLSAGVSAGLIGAAVGIGGSLLINALAPPSTGRLRSLSGADDGGRSNTLSITGIRNQEIPFGVAPSVLGKHRMYPPFAAKPFTEIVGDDQYLRVLFTCGKGPMNFSQLKIGETLLDNFDDVETEIRQGFDNDAALTLFTNDVFEETLQIALTSAGSWQERTTQLNVDEISVDIAFPSGLFKFAGSQKTAASVLVEVEYSVTGQGAWVSAGNFDITASDQNVIRKGLRWTVTPDQYDVRLRRVTSDSADPQVIDLVFWTALRSITCVDPIQNFPNATKIAMRIKATDQLNGIVDTFNLIASRLIPKWNGATWLADQETSNPAALFRHVAQGPENKRALADSRLALSNLEYWHEKNEAEGREFNQVIDFQTDVETMLRNIASAGRARLARPDGKWGVVIDERKTVPVQNFTQRNSFGFSGTIVYPDLPHAFRVNFVNRDKEYKQDERLVADDGYTEETAERIEELSLVGIVDPEEVYKEGRYHIATLRLRREIYTFSTDVEFLVAKRGDLITFTHDIPLFGQKAGRIKELNIGPTGLILGFTLDEKVQMISSKTYSARIRTSDGNNIVKMVSPIDGETDTLVFVTPIGTAGFLDDFGFIDSILTGIDDQVVTINEGDLVMFGESGLESADLIIKDIEPGEKESAKLVCVDAAPAVHSADQGAIPDFNSQISAPIVVSQPIIAEIRSDETALLIGPQGTPEVRILISLGLVQNVPVDKVEALDVRFRVANTTGPWNWLPPHPADARNVSITAVEEGEFYDIELRYRFRDGSLGNFTQQLNYQVEGILINPRSEFKEGFPGSKTGCIVYNSGLLVAISSQTIDDLPASISLLANSIHELLTTVDPIEYTTEEIDFGADVTFRPRIKVETNGAATITVQTGTNADGFATGAFNAPGTVTARYLKVKVSVAGARSIINDILISLDTLTGSEFFNDVDTSSETASWFESLAAGNFKIETRGSLAAINVARIDALIGVGAGFTWELVSKNTTLTSGSLPAAEFKIRNAAGALADATVDITLQGGIV